MRQCLKLLTPWLDPQRLLDLARATGFTRRTPKKLTPLLFVQSALLLVSQTEVCLRRWAALIGVLGHLRLAKQSLWERLNPRAVEFLHRVLEWVLGQPLRRGAPILPSVLQSFRRALVQDSTTIQLSAGLAALFPGSSNQRGAKHGQLKIQSIYDLMAQRFVSFSLSGFTRNDQAAARDVCSLVQAGDLVVRDLGYFVVESLQQIAQAGAFFLSRLRLDTGLADPQSQKPLDLLRQLKRYGQLDLQVLLGKHQLPVRLVAVKLPEAVAAERRRKARQNRDRRCRPSARALALLGWAIFVTNVSPQLWSAQTVARIYGLRWRIETIFKTWKSHFRITQVPKGSEAQLRAVIYARLIFVTVLAQVSAAGWLDPWRSEEPPARSLLKLAGLLGDFFLLLCLEAWNIRVTEAWLLQLDYHGRYERRTRSNFAQTFMNLP